MIRIRHLGVSGDHPKLPRIADERTRDLAAFILFCYPPAPSGPPNMVWQDSSSIGEDDAMLRLLSFLSSETKQLAAARTVLEHVAELINARVSLRLWDGTLVPLGRDVDPELFISISGPGVIGSLLRWPTLDNLLRHYATGRIGFHGGDLMKFGDVARIERSRSRFKQLK